MSSSFPLIIGGLILVVMVGWLVVLLGKPQTSEEPPVKKVASAPNVVEEVVSLRRDVRSEKRRRVIDRSDRSNNRKA